ncbi:MAG: hypothetical protein WAV38_20080, partial [Xanthobacteraceae bacterium]
AMAATSRTRTRPSSRYCGEPKLTLVKLDYEFHLQMWPDCCFQLALFTYRLRCPFGLRKCVLTIAKPLKFLTERKIAGRAFVE